MVPKCTRCGLSGYFYSEFTLNTNVAPSRDLLYKVFMHCEVDATQFLINKAMVKFGFRLGKKILHLLEESILEFLTRRFGDNVITLLVFFV